MSTDTKRCSDCREEKPRDSFRRRAGKPHLIESVCIPCKRKRDREHHRGLTLALGCANTTRQKHLRPLQHVATLLQRAAHYYHRGDLAEVLRYLAKAELMLTKVKPKA